MAQAPLTFLERKWAGGYANNLISAATQTTERKSVPAVDTDTHRSISPFGRRVLMQVGRYLYWNCSPVRNAVDEIARHAVSSYIAQFYGSDKTWGEEAENYLYENDRFVDVRGAPYSMAIVMKNLVRQTIVDGGQGALLTELDGSPKLQIWRTHRIGSPLNLTTVPDGPFKGSSIIDGVILDAIGRPIGYALLSDDRHAQPIAYVSANDFMLSFLPSFSDQLREISILGASAFDFQDVNESRAFELIAQKIGASYAMIVENETGEADQTQQMLALSTAQPNDNGGITDLPKEVHTAGRVQYFKAGSNQKITPVQNDRPSANVMAFQDEIIRSGLEGIGWSFDFSHNPTKAGGAQMRIVIEKVNARLDEIRKDLVQPFRRRFDGYRIAKAIKVGFLRSNPEWFKWAYQGPAKLTADRKYDSDIDLAETARGLRSERNAIAARGEYYEEVYREREEEESLKCEAANRLAAKTGQDFVTAYNLLWRSSPNGVTAAPKPPTEGDGGNTETSETDEIKARMDSYGVGVRAGAITPTVEDEEHFRSEAGLPPLSSAARSTWSKEDNVRRPITLTPPGGEQAAPRPGAQPQEDSEE